MTKPMPSLKRLEEAFPGKGEELRKLLKKETKTRSYKSVQELEKACYNPPSYDYRLMTAINEIVEGFGVEYLYKPGGGEAVADYINMGDTYNTTIIRKVDTGTIIITTMGDFVESNRL